MHSSRNQGDKDKKDRIIVHHKQYRLFSPYVTKDSIKRNTTKNSTQMDKNKMIKMKQEKKSSSKLFFKISVKKQEKTANTLTESEVWFGMCAGNSENKVLVQAKHSHKSTLQIGHFNTGKKTYQM